MAAITVEATIPMVRTRLLLTPSVLEKPGFTPVSYTHLLRQCIHGIAEKFGIENKFIDIHTLVRPVAKIGRSRENGTEGHDIGNSLGIGTAFMAGRGILAGELLINPAQGLDQEMCIRDSGTVAPKAIGRFSRSGIRGNALAAAVHNDHIRFAGADHLGP